MVLCVQTSRPFCAPIHNCSDIKTKASIILRSGLLVWLPI